MDAWLRDARDALARTAGLAPSVLELDGDEVQTLLELARIAAQESGERINAPLLCYLVGLARRGAELDELADAVKGVPG